MKRFTLFTVFFSFLLTSCYGQDQKNTNAVDQSTSKIEVLDFHSTHRCMTCNAIEANTRYTLKTYFAKELKTKKITFQVINVDDEKNEKIAEKYEASGTGLYLNVVNNGQETQINLTDFAFMYGNDQTQFSRKLSSKIKKELQTL